MLRPPSLQRTSSFVLLIIKSAHLVKSNGPISFYKVLACLPHLLKWFSLLWQNLKWQKLEIWKKVLLPGMGNFSSFELPLKIFVLVKAKRQTLPEVSKFKIGNFSLIRCKHFFISIFAIIEKITSTQPINYHNIKRLSNISTSTIWRFQCKNRKKTVM